MIETILGLIAAAGFIGYSVPQMIAVAKAKRLQGYSRMAWTLLFIAILAIQAQLFVSHLWIASVAQAFNTVAAGYTYIQVLRKSGSPDEEDELRHAAMWAVKNFNEWCDSPTWHGEPFEVLAGSIDALDDALMEDKA